MTLLLLGACLDRLLESPYVLAPGLGETRSVSLGPDHRLLVATSTGLWVIDGEGKAEHREEAPIDAVSSHPDRTYVLRGDRIDWLGGGITVPGARDILAGYDGLYVLTDHGVDRVQAATGALYPVAAGLTGGRGLALAGDGYLVVTADSLLHLDASGAVRTLATGLVDARAAAVDGAGRVYVAQGDPSELWRVDGEDRVPIARWLGDPRDLAFGGGDLLPVENLYVANGSGTLDYVRPP